MQGWLYQKVLLKYSRSGTLKNIFWSHAFTRKVRLTLFSINGVKRCLQPHIIRLCLQNSIFLDRDVEAEAGSDIFLDDIVFMRTNKSV